MGVGEAVERLIVTKSEIAMMRLNMRGGEGGHFGNLASFSALMKLQWNLALDID